MSDEEECIRRLEKKLDHKDREIGVLRRRLIAMRQLASWKGAHGHFDATMQHGAGCRQCIHDREMQRRINALARGPHVEEGGGA